MKLLPILILTVVLSVGVACSFGGPKFSEGEASGLVEGALRIDPGFEGAEISLEGYSKAARVAIIENYRTCYYGHKGEFSEVYLGDGVWSVELKYTLDEDSPGWKHDSGEFFQPIIIRTWRVHEGSNAVERGEGTYQKVCSSGEQETTSFNCPTKGR